MKSIRSLKRALALLGLIGALCSASIAHAQLSYLVDINTSSIVNHSAGPFSLDFDSIAGSGTQTITLSNFVFTGGNAFGAGNFTGAVSGDLGTSLVFNPTPVNFYSEFFQQFDASVSNIKFTLNLTTNAASPSPTSFTMSILDSNLSYIPTTADSNYDRLVMFNIDGNNTSFGTFTSNGATPGVTVSLTAIPEPSTYGLLVGATVFAAGIWRRRSISRA